MDPSALIFVALAVAWAVYLIPKALQHHDDVVRSRSVDRFSHTMRVLARREPVEPAQRPPGGHPRSRPPRPRSVVDRQGAPTRRPAVLRRRAARPPTRAARRRRRVLGLILLANVVVVGRWPPSASSPGRTSAIPAGLLVAWLVACRLMVRSERAAWTTPVRRIPVEMPTEEVDEDEPASSRPSTPRVSRSPPSSTPRPSPRPSTDPTLWDPVPVTLPTYVTKPAATRRSVRTIDLDSTPACGPPAAPRPTAPLAREADAADRAARKQAGDDQRAVGSYRWRSALAPALVLRVVRFGTARSRVLTFPPRPWTRSGLWRSW